MFITF